VARLRPAAEANASVCVRVHCNMVVLTSILAVLYFPYCILYFLYIVFYILHFPVLRFQSTGNAVMRWRPPVPISELLISVAADAPVITFAGRFNPLIVVESSSVTLRCLVDANPPVHARSVRWLRSGIPQGSYTTISHELAWYCHRRNLATAADKLEGTSRGVDADPLTFSFLPPSLPRLPLLSQSCFSHSFPYCSFLLPVNLARRSAEAL